MNLKSNFEDWLTSLSGWSGATIAERNGDATSNQPYTGRTQAMWDAFQAGYYLSPPLQ